MTEIDENGEELAGGSLADAIAAHLELKKEHGADPEELERELESALAPANRDEDDQPVAVEPAPEPAAPEPVPEPVVESALEPVPEPVVEAAPEPPPAVEAPAVAQPAAVEPEPEPTPVEPEPIAASAPEPQPEPAASPAPGEITGTIEFEWDKETDQPPEPVSDTVEVDHDLLEDTPDFFEETPEHDKLWFDEAPPRKFDF